jgi:hypothetical protein
MGRGVLIYLLLSYVFWASAQAQQQSQQPLNASVSDIGTSFVISPPPVCGGCLETELGYLHLEDGNYAPGVLTLGLTKYTDANVLVNLLDSEAPESERVTHFGNRFDFIVRQQVAKKRIFELTLAPRGTVFVRGGDGGRVGMSAAPLFAWGANQIAVNVTWTGGVNVSAMNPRSDEVAAFDWFRTVQPRGTAFFAGFQQETSAGTTTASIEEGLVLPFRNGQVELATEQLNLNTAAQVQAQARVIVNWGNLIRKKRDRQ